MQTLSHINHIIQNWPSRSRRTAQDIIDTYGLPHEAADSMLIWRYNQPWKRTIVYRDGVHHNFPRPHMDVLEQTIDYKVPLEKYKALAEFDGSILIDRTRGELSVHCDSEKSNVLMLNLAHQIVLGKTSVRQAREMCARLMGGLRFHWHEPMVERLQFTPGADSRDRESFTQDPDKRARVGV